MSDVRRQLITILAVAAPTCAVLPIVANLSGGWIALHLAGGAISLVILLWAAWQLPSRARWPAYAAIAISLAVVGVVTGGGTFGRLAELAMGVVLGTVYLVSVGAALRTKVGPA